MDDAPGFRLETERLTVRLLGRADISGFVRYRNLPEVARFQDWPMPFTRDHAVAIVESIAALGGPSSNEWVQLAIEREGELVGDLAVWLDGDGQLAMVGYTVAPEHQHQGYAAEALAALVDWLFTERGVHRIAATIDPRNLPSARVLERSGFRHVGTAPSSALVRGEWTDDARFSLLADEWRSWRSRATDPPHTVELVEITHDMVRRVGALAPAYSQQGLVSPVLVSLAEARIPPVEDGETVVAWYRAIVADGELVGFVMVAEPTSGHPHPFLWRFLIDARDQRRGIGRRAIVALARERARAGHRYLDVSYKHDVPGTPRGFYRSLGFVPTGEYDGDEEVARLDLTPFSD